MDSETWMDANKAIELGFADDIIKRSEISDDIEVPSVSMLYNEASVTNFLMSKLAEKCKITKNTVEADSLMDRLNLIKNWR